MSPLSSKLDKAIKNLFEKGFSTVHGFPYDTGKYVLELLAERIGYTVTFFGQPEIMNVKPQKGFSPVSSGGAAPFPLHTDITFHKTPPQYIAMFCIHPGEGDGIPKISDGFQAFKNLSEEDQHCLLSLTLAFPPPSHVENAGYEGSVISLDKNDFFVRFNIKCMNKCSNKSLTLFFDQLNQISREIIVKPGTLIIYDNYRYLHGRTGIKARLASKRHLLRMYINNQNPSSKAR